MSTISMHPTKGLDPHLCFCPRCGKDNGELAVGYMIVLCENDGTIKGYVDPNRIHNLSRTIGDYTRDLEPNEKVPGNVCDACIKETAELHKVVEEGGVFFKCDQCGISGAIQKTPFAEAVRATHGLAAPAPCGVLFDTCDEHIERGINTSNEQDENDGE